MTRAVRNRILKDANGDISDHLRNHIHLTNCIHLKNHMHKHSPLLHDKSLMRDLIVLQRSRSLRDPSASPPPWHSPVIADLLSRDGERLENGRRSTGEHSRDGRRLSQSSPPLESLEAGRTNYQAALGSEHSSKSGAWDVRREREKESSRKSDLSGGNQGTQPYENGNELSQGVSGNSDRKSRKSTATGKYSQEGNPKTLSQQLHEITMDSDGVLSSNKHPNGRHSKTEKLFEEAEPSVRGACSGFNKVRRRKFRRVKRPGAMPPRDNRPQNDISVASNSSVKGVVQQRHPMGEEEEEVGDHNVSRGPRNGCGIPFNWSRIHHRGKTILDIAGRSLSCGLSDPRLKRGGQMSQGRDASDFPAASDQSSSCSKSDAEALPLLVDGSESSDNAAWAHDYSGELGLFADSLLKRDIESDLASEARSGDQRKLRGGRHARHQNLTQKYMPRTFRDLVGQNLVAQALSNAIVRRKVGLLYVFHGPHGTGKTSSARIFARALNCQSPEHPKPCGYCGSCVAHDMGKSRTIKEISPVSNFDFESIMDLFENMMLSQQASQYRVFIFDDCDTLSHDCWSAISKVIDRPPRRVVFVLICSSLDVLPHIIISRCQKFFFPKLKDADIIYALQWIATKEGLDIDRDALKLIASRSDGSLRDAEMTLEQLSLLGQRISVTLVQELVGLISDEKLVDLLDFALSADTVNTVKNLREIMESGAEPLALMSQLATVITDVLAGTYNFTKERRRRKFFRRQPLSKEDMEKLRQALKTLSEAEKQLRMSSDKLTWLTAALLQLAPDQQYMLPSSSAEDTSFNHSPLPQNDGRAVTRKGGMERAIVSNNGRRFSTESGMEKHYEGSPSGTHDGSKVSGNRRQGARIASHETSAYDGMGVCEKRGKGHTEIEDIWLEVLQNIQISCVKEFMYQEGKLISVSYGAAPTVQLLFSSLQTKSKAEKLRAYILQAFEAVLGSPVTIEIRSESRKDARLGGHTPLVLPTSEDRYGGSSRMIAKNKGNSGTSEIVELAGSPREQNFSDHVDIHGKSDKRDLRGARAGETVPSFKHPDSSAVSERGRFGEENQCRSLVRGKVSLAHVIQQAEGSSQRSAWTKRKAVSIAEKLEQENLRLEPKSRNLLCWKPSRTTRRKLSRLKIRARRPHSLLKLVSCGKCLSSRSPR
ncbi:protein STICHEL-like 3 isoform X1 [Chenopodium quinoa]|uniref:protein STICHEL-like 3 isoform X1 n=1 Tax=Chenopodium quinoa TaxID=63459 RepID=UPI000B77A2D0|nr:protein STICHEL-like 3 isoform X1 [Chenopodium quinoa]